MLTKAPKGTKDILPSESKEWQRVEAVFRNQCEKYGFGEIRTPIFEHTELFQRGVGDTTDIVEKQMYTFPDMKNRSLSLKPEGTAGVVRSFIENKIYAEPQPTKLSYITPCFRYENTQKGRQRQFHQFGIEIFGTKSMTADAEVIVFAADFLEELGVGELELRINSIGCPVCRANHREALQAFLKPKYDALCDTCKTRYYKNPMRIIDCKSPSCQELTQGAPVMLDFLCDDCSSAFDELKISLDAMDVKYVVDAGIVRGLDYYTKTAFEIVTNTIGAQGTVCGGGRYDDLVKELGGPPTPGIGFGLGIERLLLVMEATGVDTNTEEETDVFVAYIGEKAKNYTQSLIRKLRKAGYKAQMDLMERNMKGQFKMADRINARYTISIGDDEIAANKFNMKNMKTSEQIRVSLEDIYEALEK